MVNENHLRFKLLSFLFLFILILIINPPLVPGCDWAHCWHGNTIIIESGMIVGSIRSGCGHDTIIVEPGAQVVADEGSEAVGIDSGNGHDSVVNGGTITVIATDVQGAGEGSSYECAGWKCGSCWAKTSPDASATAVGIDTGNGSDSVLNTGTISVTASSLLTDSGTASSLAIGIDSGNGKDSSENVDSAIVSAAPADVAGGAPAIEVTASSSASLSDTSWEYTGVHKVDLSVDTEAAAIGIAGGNGKDTISNAATLSVSAVSDITVEGTSATLLGVGGVNMSVRGSALAVGIDGGNGRDQIINLGDITVSAVSDIETDSIAVSGFGAAEVNDSEFDGSTESTASAVGIYTGNSKDEVFGISNSSSIDVQSTASVNADSYALTLAGDGITDTSLSASAAAVGIGGGFDGCGWGSGCGGGCGKDTITNEGTLTVGASAAVDSFSFDLNFLDIFKSKADIDAQAAAVGIASGSGKDSIDNSGTISVSADAGVEAWVAEFNMVDVAIGDFSSTSSAAAVGISSGQGKDTITNTGTISADASADALVGNFTLTMVDLTLIPDLMDTVGNASTTVDATAVGITSGIQDDTINSSGDVSATATTEATTIAVGVGAEGIPAGVPQGDILSFENLASAGVELSSVATGIDSGTGNDEITNQGNITADASATYWGGSLSLSLPLLEKVVPFPSPAFAMISAGTEVGSEATGIQAGEGDDLIVNEGSLDVDAYSGALNVAASMAFQGFVSEINTIDIAAARVDALTEAQATATGIEGGTGNDRIISSGDITVDAATETLTIAAAIAVQKKAKEAVNLEGTLADVRATTASEATGISGGRGHDTIESSGNTTVSAESSNAGVGLSAAVTCESEKGLTANAAVAKADTTATAGAVGIDGGEGWDKIHNSGAVDVTAEAGTVSAAIALTLQGSNTDVIGLQGALATVTTTAEATAEGLSGGSGNDCIANEGSLTVEADALAIAASVAVDIMPGKTKGIGIALANAQNAATATATGISGGDGDECIQNSGTVTVDADATAVAASVSVVRKGAAGTGTLDPVSFDSGNNAEAVATAIDGGAGNEVICNSGALDVSATAVAPSVGVAVSSKGVSAAITTASASASATGIDTGDGTHWVHNTGAISADALATAVGVSVSVAGEGVAAGIDTVWDGGTTATAAARGIHAGSGHDVIINEAAITASSTAVAPSVDVAVTGKGVSAGISTATSEALSVGIDSGEGDDCIYNSGDISATSIANADSITVDIAGKGVAASVNYVWDGGVEATAVATGIDAGAGGNTVVNSGNIDAQSTAVTASVGVSVVGKGVAVSVSTATATAQAVGIDPGETTESLCNSGDISADATAVAATVNVDVSGQGVAVAADAVWDGGTKATATARGIEAGYVDNTITNEGKIDVETVAVAPSVAVSVAGKGLTAAISTATATSDAIGISTGAGNDVVLNSGAIQADATANADAINVAVAGQGVAAAADAVWDGGTTATARAMGIDTGTGDDSVFNSADIQADSTAVTVGVGVAVAGEGVSAAVSTSTAEALATGIAAGQGSDTIESAGNISADAASTAVTANVAVTGTGVAVAADAVWDGGTRSTAVAKGIDAGSGTEDETVISRGDITVTSDAVTVGASISVTAQGVSLATSTSTATALSAGIASGASNDTIQSEGAITADANATGVAVAASITATGVSGAADAVWDGGTHTTAIATGIDAGDEDDTIISKGDISSTSSATTVAVDAAITATGVSLAASTATTTAAAAGIDAGAGNDTIQSDGAITADASATGVAVAASITAAGVAGSTDAVWDGGTDTTAVAMGIDGGAGDDVINSTGNISASAEATTVAVDAAIAVKGVALAASASSTTAQALGINGGAGDDTIDNTGNIDSYASGTGVGVAVGLTGLGLSGATDAVWDSGTKALTVAKGIEAGARDDTITNEGDISVTSDANTVAVDVAFTVAGLSAAMTNTSVEAKAVGIDGGAGEDTITNEGAITGSADATAVGVAVSLSGAGASVSATDLWENGVSGESLFVGIDAGAGDDTIANSGAITGTAETTTPAISASVSLAGIGAAANTATADAVATGIEGGTGNDTITNTGAIGVASTADANTVIVSVTGVGAAAAMDSIWDGGTTATATATGIAGGDGNDIISNTAAIAASATADTASTGVTATLAGASASLVNSTAIARAAGIDGGAGDDTISNSGVIAASATADADTVAVSVSGVGASFAGDQWSEDTLASATAVGIDGGAGNDTITNSTAITAAAVSNSDSTAVTVSLVGYADSEAENRAEALAAGIGGGDDNDTIDNSGAIAVSSSATADAGNVTVNLAGAAPAEAGTTASAVGIGIDGGAGNDAISNTGAIAVTSIAKTDSSSVTVTLAGYGDSEADTLSLAAATGISGGDGNDTITNTGTITLASAATADAGSVSIGLAGAVFGEAGTTASAATVGLDGGAGSDVIENSGAIVATSSASTDSSSTGVVLAGYGESSAECASIAAAIGISGGDGDDTIVNHAEATITLTSLATSKAGSVSVGLAGAVGGEAGTTATAFATAVDGGTGSDTIQNAAQIDVDAATSTTADSTTVGIFGTADADVDTTATTLAGGIAGGEGDDTITNTGNISVSSSSTMSLDAYAFDLAGTGGSQGTLQAYSSSVGISGGEGSDTIDNEGQLTVSASAVMTVEGGSDVAFGSASAGANTTAVTDAAGIDAGDGDDTISNRNTITVNALTTMSLDSSSFTFGGTAASGEGAMYATTRAVGISGGEGSDSITSDALITVNPKTTMNALSDSDVAFGSADAGTSITANTEATGIGGGGGDDTIINRGGIKVGYYNASSADAMTKIDVSGSTWSFGGTGAVSAAALATGSSIGIDGGEGDDTILSEANIEVNSTAYAKTYGSSYSFAGSSGSNAVVTASSSALGIGGGAGNDTITNSAVLTVRARSYTSSTGSASTTFGSSDAVAGATSNASAAGIDGGSGGDTIENTGTISVGAYAHAYVSTDSDVFAGNPTATSTGTVAAAAAGIDAGGGSNSIDNRGLISVSATAVSDPDATADSDISDNESDAVSAMSAGAVGITAGSGDDTIGNSESGSIIVKAATSATPHAHSDEDSAATAYGYTTEAVGVEAGDGYNTITNLGTIESEAKATITATAVSRSLTMTARSNAVAAARVEAAGITSGSGNDLISNGENAAIRVKAEARATALGTPRGGESDHTDVGTGTAGLSWFPVSATASGIAAGGGDNTIDNLGLIDVEARTVATAKGESDTDNTSNTSRANAAAAAVASGIQSGDGTDAVLNDTDATIQVRASTDVDATAFPDEEGYINNPGVSAASAAYGIKLGNGPKSVINRGTISAIAESVSDTRITAESDLWDTECKTVAAVSAAAQGIATGSGDTSISNSGKIEVRATADSYDYSVSDSVDDAWSQLNAVITATAQGIEAEGGGTVTVDNSGSIDVEAIALYEASGRGDSGGDGYGEVYMTLDPTVSAAGILVGNAGSCAIHNQAGSTISVDAQLNAKLSLNGDEYAVIGRNWDHGIEAEITADGIAAGNGQAAISNDGTIQVTLDSYIDGRTHSRSTTRSTHTYAWMTSVATAVGIRAGNGAHSIDNTGFISVAAFNTVLGNINHTASDSYYNARAEVGAYAYTNAYGIFLGNGDAEVSNSGTIEVMGESSGYGYTRGDSGAGDGIAVTYVTTNAAAAGIHVGSGGSFVSVENSGGITARAVADCDEAYAHGDDDSYAYGSATSRSAGIELGNNTTMVVDNSGTIAVTSDAHSHVADDEPTMQSGTNAKSYGISVGNGSSTISNSGRITANSASTATWYSDEKTYWSGAAAEASGISALDGNKQIVNDGRIEATAYAEVNYGAAAAYAYGIHAEAGNNTIINNGTISSTAITNGYPSLSATAYGIKTGAGDDTIINNGTIVTKRIFNGLTFKGVGIDTGTGNDQVVFGDGSYIGCDLDLGEGNDGLTVIGSGSISGNVYGGLGTDALTLDGATNFDLDRTFDFESLMKLGSSTVSLNNAQMLESLEVLEGILQINSDYQFTDSGSFSAQVYGGGACGKLIVDGSLGLDGTMTVVRGPGAYLDGATYEVLTAGTLSGAFASLLLPGSTPLLRFDVSDMGKNSYLVTASTQNFASVAETRIQRAITENLDAVIGSAKGDLSLVLGEIQAMPASGYGTAFSSLSPDSYDCSTKTTFSSADQFTQVLSNRLRSLRSSSAGHSGNNSVRPLIDRTAFGSTSQRSGTSSGKMESYGMWLSGFGQWGGFDAADDYTGFDFNLYGTTLGYDRYLGRNLTAGASLGYANTNVYFDDDRGTGLIRTITGSAYGSCSAEHVFLETALSYGRQSYENSRKVEVGSIQRVAESAHGGNTLQAYLGGGLSAGIAPLTVEPLAGLQYMYLGEAGFSEEGAGSVSLNVQERTSHSLVSDLGMRLGLCLDTRRGNLSSELYAAWRHDFPVDGGTITACFVDAPDAPFTISAPRRQADGVLLGASLTLKEFDRFSAVLKYSLELRGQYAANSLTGEIHYGF